MHDRDSEKEKIMTVFLAPPTFEWLRERAKRNGRAKCREASVILEAERHREARHLSPGVLGSQGGVQ